MVTNEDGRNGREEKGGRLRPCLRAWGGHYFGMNHSLRWLTALVALLSSVLGFKVQAAAPRPNIILILADDMGYSDLGCYGSEINTPNLDRLAAGGLRFTQFYNAARCCPTRAALLTGLYPHQAGVGHMLQDYKQPGYTKGLNDNSATIAELLHEAGYRTYHVGKWHVGGVGGKGAEPRNHPLSRGFDRAYGSGGGGNYFALQPLYMDRENIKPGDNFYATDAFSDWAVRFLDEHKTRHKEQPFFLHLCYTAPHFPLHAKPEDIAKYRGKYRGGWDKLRETRFAREKELGIMDKRTQLSPRDPVAKAWDEVPEAEKDEWDLRMAVHAAMIDCMDQGIGRVMEMVKLMGAEENTLVVFLSDNGASAEYLDSWPNPNRGHKQGSITGTKESHRTIEIGWANAANTPFRECKMWTHEGGISTSFIANWPAGIKARGKLTEEVGHIVDLMPTFLELAGGDYPARYRSFDLKPLAGMSLVPVLQGKKIGDRTLGWEHEGNRAYRVGDWKLVATFKGDWELYDLSKDRSEVNNLAAKYPKRVAEMAALWQQWADNVGVVPWEQLPGATYKPTKGYQKKSEPVVD